MVIRQIFFVLAWALVSLGVVGVFLPVLPTTPFLLAAAYFFARSSPRFYRWLTTSSYLRAYIDNYRSGTGVPWRMIRRSLIFLWAGLTLSSLLWSNGWYWLLLATVGVGVSAHLLMLRRAEEKRPPTGDNA
ncbi:MAG TPA: YbaN family protein [Lentisphaeria bacterium]|nr:YbaN family protein [Lentisphaeria bacterium]